MNTTAKPVIHQGSASCNMKVVLRQDCTEGSDRLTRAAALLHIDLQERGARHTTDYDCQLMQDSNHKAASMRKAQPVQTCLVKHTATQLTVTVKRIDPGAKRRPQTGCHQLRGEMQRGLSLARISPNGHGRVITDCCHKAELASAQRQCIVQMQPWLCAEGRFRAAGTEHGSCR